MKKSILPLALTAAFVLPHSAVAQDARPDPAKLKVTVEKLVSFGTRHSLSTTTDPKRGIGAARKWAAGEFDRISKSCGDCLKVETVADRFTGPRAPDGVEIVDVLAIQNGTGDPDQVVIVAGHIDSRASDAMNATIEAPGANDDGSGSALVMEAARILSKQKFNATIVYALLSGEEQGLWGGTLLANTAKARGWQVRAMLNNDIVGNTLGQDGSVVADRVRVFSEGIQSSEDLTAAMARRAIGGEDDSPSRALAKRIAHVAQSDKHIGLSVLAVRRPDRFGRGGDHTPMLAAGFPAVRFTVGVENYDRQHQDLRTENGRIYGDTVDAMDFDYLAKVTALNVDVLAQLASAPAAPARVDLDGAVSTDTKVSWTPVDGTAAYHVYWRRADAQDWTGSQLVKGDSKVTLPLIVDDNFIGVAAVAENGSESLVTFGGLPPRR